MLSSAVKRHVAQTIEWLANSRFTTSIPGVGKNMYSSCGYVINLYLLRLSLSVNFSHIEFRHSFAKVCVVVLRLIASLSSTIPSLA